VLNLVLEQVKYFVLFLEESIVVILFNSILFYKTILLNIESILIFMLL